MVEGAPHHDNDDDKDEDIKKQTMRMRTLKDEDEDIKKQTINAKRQIV